MPVFCEECPEECPDRNRVAAKGSICARCVSRTGRPNPPESEEVKRRRLKLEALKPKPIPLPRPDRILYPFPTPVKKNTAYIAGKAAFDAEFREISKVYPERKITISVVAHSKGSTVSFNQECCDGSLVGGKKKGVYRKFKIVRLDVKHDIACWRGLLLAECNALRL